MMGVVRSRAALPYSLLRLQRLLLRSEGMQARQTFGGRRSLVAAAAGSSS